MYVLYCVCFSFFFFSSRRRHTSCALVTGVQTCALPIWDYQVSSYTVYTSDLNLSIDRAATGERLFEGRAQAQSRDSDLTAIVPNLVQAMFTGFPGNSGERVRITVAPPEKG